MAGTESFFWLRNSGYYKWKFHWKKLKFIKKQIHDPRNHLIPLILHYFASKGCFIKSKCKIRNTRFHFIDVRQEKFGYHCKFDSLMWATWNELVDHYIKQLELAKNNLEQHEIIRYFRDDLYIFFKKYIKNLKDITHCFSTKDKIYKQLNKSELKKEIINYYKKQIDLTLEALIFLYYKMKNNIDYLVNNSIQVALLNIKGKYNNKFYLKMIKKVYGKKYNELYKKLKKILDKNRSNLDDRTFDSLEEIYFYAQNLLVDLYFLGRMSRKFYNKSQNNVIVIAGSAHIHNYTKFLKSIGYKYKWQSKQESEKCSVIPNILSH